MANTSPAITITAKKKQGKFCADIQITESGTKVTIKSSENEQCYCDVEGKLEFWSQRANVKDLERLLCQLVYADLPNIEAQYEAAQYLIEDRSK